MAYLAFAVRANVEPAAVPPPFPGYPPLPPMQSGNLA